MLTVLCCLVGQRLKIERNWFLAMLVPFAMIDLIVEVVGIVAVIHLTRP